jgi:Spy/CpxP family protein refolding chaperone
MAFSVSSHYITGMADQQPPTDDGLTFSDQPFHAAFETQIREMLDQADLTEEQKQQILVAMQCACCGAGGLSLSIKLKD